MLTEAVKQAWRRFPSAWARSHYYIPSSDIGVAAERIKLAPYQEAILDYAFARENGRLRFDTVLISQPKKSGKTTLAGLVGRWAAETWGQYGEVLYVGNDLAQAQGRGFAAHKQSIELTPGFVRSKNILPDRWEVLSTAMKCLTTGTVCRAIATDYQGEAGANPIITIWEELWGFIHKDALRFWAEVAPSPARPDSVRLVVTYAGYEGESELLWSLYEQTVKEGRQLRVKDMRKASGAFAEAPTDDSLIPCWVNDSKRMLTFWDSGTEARRMPWLQGERGRTYYASEEATQTPNQYRRLHLNEWVGAESEFIPIAWWDACLKPPWPLKPGEDTPLVLAVDAGVSNDYFGLTIGCRIPGIPDDKPPQVALREAWIWKPPKGGKISFDEPYQVVTRLIQEYNVVEVCYDSHELVAFMQQLMANQVVNCFEFSQQTGRDKSDKLLYDLIMGRRIQHSGNDEVREHLSNCAAKVPKDEDNKLRIIKKSETRKIDLAVCLSMMCYEILRLNI